LGIGFGNRYFSPLFFFESALVLVSDFGKGFFVVVVVGNRVFGIGCGCGFVLVSDLFLGRNYQREVCVKCHKPSLTED
jgi:hypothetical protein